MQIRSLGFQTNLMFSRFAGSVKDRGDYLVIQTPSNPGFHWGNYIIFSRAPQKGDLKTWTRTFDVEFPYYKEPHHYVFAWEEEPKSDFREFSDAGFKSDSSVVLTCNSLRSPAHLNQDIRIQKIQSDREWKQAVELQNLCADPQYLNDYYYEFKQRQMDQYRKMSEAGRGYWFGAFLGDKLVGDLGIFQDQKFGRYQSVGTHPDFRRKGICATLVYQAGLMMQKEYGLDLLVMEADPEYHAARVYESVGFKRNEVSYSLSWWKRSNH